MFFYIKCVLFVLVLSISGEISAQEKRDSVRIYFHQGKVNIDTCLLDNGNEMERFAKICSALNDSVRSSHFPKNENPSPIPESLYKVIYTATKPLLVFQTAFHSTAPLLPGKLLLLFEFS